VAPEAGHDESNQRKQEGNRSQRTHTQPFTCDPTAAQPRRACASRLRSV
jgi:hypothetical protein